MHNNNNNNDNNHDNDNIYLRFEYLRLSFVQNRTKTLCHHCIFVFLRSTEVAYDGERNPNLVLSCVRVGYPV